MAETIGHHLQNLRKSLGLTLRDVQRQTGVSNSFLSQVENGQAVPSPDNLVRLSKVYNTSFVELMRKSGHTVLPGVELLDGLSDEEVEQVKDYVRVLREGRTDEG